MGVSTSIVANHKVITPPVSFADANSVFGTSYTDLSAISTHSRINRWAKYKPVIRPLIDTTDQLNSNNTWKTGTGGATWWKATAQNCGISVSVYSDLVTMIKTWYKKTNYAWQDFWQYAPPTGASSAPFRLTDLNYYCHISTQSGGEDNDKPLSGFMVGGEKHEIHRYQIDGTYYTDGQAQLYIRPDNPYLLSITDISIPDGAGLSSFRKAYFGVAAIRTNQNAGDSSYYMAAITTPYTFDVNAPASDWHPAGKDLRYTPLFPELSFRNQVNMDFLFFPFLTTSAISADSSTAQWGAKSSVTGAKYIPLPFYPLEVSLLPQTPTVKITARFGTVTSSGSGLSVQVTFKAENLLSSGTPSWANNKVNIKFMVFKDGQSPPTINESNYVPASTSFTGSSWPKTYTTTYSLTGAASGKNEIQVYLESSEGTILVGSGDHYSNL